MPRIFTISETCDALRLGRTKIFDLIRRGELRTVRVGRAVRVTEGAIADFIARLERDSDTGDADMPGAAE